MKKLVFALLACLPAFPALAQTPTGTQKVSWVAPMQYTDGTAIPSTVALTYNVYARMGGAAQTKLRAGVTTTSITQTALPVGQTNCYQITVVAAGIESSRSPEACGVVQGLATKPVTTVVIQ